MVSEGGGRGHGGGKKRGNKTPNRKINDFIHSIQRSFRDDDSDMFTRAESFTYHYRGKKCGKKPNKKGRGEET